MTAAAPFRRYRVRVATPAGAALLDTVILARGLDDAGLRGRDLARAALTVAVALLPETAPEQAQFTPEEREWVIDSVASSQQLAGVPVTREEVARILDEGDDLAPLGALDWIATAARGKEGS